MFIRLNRDMARDSLRLPWTVPIDRARWDQVSESDTGAHRPIVTSF